MSVITTTSLEFVPQSELPHTPIQTLRDGESYGVFSFETEIVSKLKHENGHMFHIMVDVSASMSDKISDHSNQTKCDLVVHTLINILHYFADNCTNVHVVVKGFDTYIHTYITKVKVTSENVDDLVARVKKIRPMLSTDIELALIELKLDTSNNDEVNQSIIFLTDGSPTKGEQDIEQLSELVSQNVPSHFIALGDNHNSDLMYRFGHQYPNTSNWFIPNIEQTGNVYGEIIFNELNNCANNVCITVSDGKIFDYNKGCFVDSLDIGNIAYESNRQFHIVTNNVDACLVVIESDSFAILSNKMVLNDPLYVVGMIKQYLRLGVQYMQASAIRNTIRNSCTIRLQQYESYLSTIESFIEKNNDDPFVQGLITDVRILIRCAESFDDTRRFLVARADSQGRQQTCNTVSEFTMMDDNDIRTLEKPKLTRQRVSVYASPGRMELGDICSQTIFDNQTLSLHLPDVIDTDTRCAMFRERELSLESEPDDDVIKSKLF